MNAWMKFQAQLTQTVFYLGHKAVSAFPHRKRWYLYIERTSWNEGGQYGEQLPPFLIGPYTKEQAEIELDADDGLLYELLTVDAKLLNYVAEEVHMINYVPAATHVEITVPEGSYVST